MGLHLASYVKTLSCGSIRIIKGTDEVGELKCSFIFPSPDLELPIEGGMVGATPPLGMMYIAAVLRNEGIQVSMIDEAAQGFSMRGTVDWVKREDPDVLGFSTYNISGYKAAKIAGKVKEENPDIVVVFGNLYATFNAERILRKYPCVDVVVRGEGEYTTLELVRSLEKNESFKKVSGVTFRSRNRIISTPDRPLIDDVDSLPFPERGLLDAEYHAVTAGINVAPRKFTTFLSSRGCVYRCRFCGCRRLARGIWRPRSVDNVLEELNLLASEGYKQLLFVDDNFTLNPKRAIRICQGIRKDKIDIEWIAEGRVDVCSYALFREMAKAQCRMLYIGIESASQKVLDYYDKGTTPEQAEAAVEYAREAGIDVIVASFILGAPNETRRELLKTVDFAQKLKVDVPQFNILDAFPGTDIWEELRAKGVLDEEKYWETGVFVPKVSPDTVPYVEIERIIREGYRRFLMQPSYIMRSLLRVARSPYRLNILFNNLKRVKTIAKGLRSITWP